MISLIAAVSENRVIGNHGDLPWRLPTDTKYFLDSTIGKTIVMGRTTFQLIIDGRNGELLPGRTNVVLTNDQNFSYPGVQVIHNVHDIEKLSDDIMIIGGAKVYDATIVLADRLFITEVHARVKGDAFFPLIDSDMWREISRSHHFADALNQYDFDFVVYERILQK